MTNRQPGILLPGEEISVICDYLEPLYAVYLDNNVTPDEQSIIEEHLARCPACRAVISWTRRALQCETDLTLRAPAGFYDRLLARLRSEA